MDPQNPSPTPNPNPAPTPQPAPTPNLAPTPQPTAAPAAAPVAPPIAQPPINDAPEDKVSLNPFLHIWRGSRNVMKTNFFGVFILTLLQLVFGILAIIIFAVGAIGSLRFSNELDVNYGQLFGVGAVALIFSLAVGIIFGQALIRMIMTAARKQKIGVVESLRLVSTRLTLTLLCALLAIGVYIAGILVVVFSGAISPIVAILLGIAGVVLLILAAFKFMYTPLVLADDQRPSGVIAAYKSSNSVWSRSRGATVLLVVLFMAVVILVSAVGGKSEESSIDSNNSENITTQQFEDDLSANNDADGADIAAIAGGGALGLIVAAFIYTIGYILLYSGVANIYNEVTAKDRKKSDDPEAVSVVNPMQPTPPSFQ
jgi:hypothetical protein